MPLFNLSPSNRHLIHHNLKSPTKGSVINCSSFHPAHKTKAISAESSTPQTSYSLRSPFFPVHLKILHTPAQMPQMLRTTPLKHTILASSAELPSVAARSTVFRGDKCNIGREAGSGNGCLLFKEPEDNKAWLCICSDRSYNHALISDAYRSVDEKRQAKLS